MLTDDLDELFAPAEGDLHAMRGARLFITGGTGFVGSWLLESLAWANARLNASISAVVLTRDAGAFAAAAPHLAAAPHVSFASGDVRAGLADLGRFDGVVHAATPASAELNRAQPLLMLDTILAGGRSVLELAARSGAIPFLFTSSGAVYGPQPPQLDALSEQYPGAPDPLSAAAAYHEGKRVAELQCALVAQGSELRPKIARLFAFVGPYLPLDRHFAVGNFVADGLGRRPLVISGDGTTVRTYLYGADMAVWLWAIYRRGEPLRAYNVGSARAVEIAELARLVARCFDPPPPLEVRQRPVPGRLVDRYVPDVSRITQELGVRESVSLDSALRRTIAYHERRARRAQASP